MANIHGSAIKVKRTFSSKEVEIFGAVDIYPGNLFKPTEVVVSGANKLVKELTGRGAIGFTREQGSSPIALHKRYRRGQPWRYKDHVTIIGKLKFTERPTTDNLEDASPPQRRNRSF